MTQLEAEALYAPYLGRQQAERVWIEKQEQISIPAAVDFAKVPGLSTEMRQRFSTARPTTLGAAARIRGVSPAAVSALALHLRQSERRFT